MKNLNTMSYVSAVFNGLAVLVLVNGKDKKIENIQKKNKTTCKRNAVKVE